MSDTTVLVKGEGWKFKAAIGLGGIIAIIALAFMYHFQVGIFLLVTGLGVGARVGVWAWHQYNLADHQKNVAFLERRFKLAEVTIKEYEAARARLMCHFLEFNTGVFRIKHPDEMIEVEFYPAVQASRLLADAPLLLPEPEPPVKRLLDIRFDHILIVGPTRSGKTTVANHLIDNAEYDATIYALDPHATQNRLKGLSWSPRAQVIGDGRDWAAIDAMLVSLLADMNDRFRRSTIPQPVYVANDEWLAVLKNCPHAKGFFETFGSEAAKVNMHLIIATQASTVDDLGCSADVRDNLVELRLSHASKAENRGELRWGRRRDSVEVVELPGPYRVAFLPARAVTEPMPTQWPGEAIQEAVEPIPILDAGPVPPVPDPTELRIFELHREGKRPHAIWKEVYPDKSYGGIQADEIKAVLAKFGVML